METSPDSLRQTGLRLKKIFQIMFITKRIEFQSPVVPNGT